MFKQHMYGGPKGLGDPNYRELSKMEEDPMIPQRMRDITRTQLCIPEVRAFSECSKNSGFSMVFQCQADSCTSGAPRWLMIGGNAREGSIKALLCLLYDIRAPLIDPFYAWKPPLCHKEPAKGKKYLS